MLSESHFYFYCLVTVLTVQNSMGSNIRYYSDCTMRSHHKQNVELVLLCHDTIHTVRESIVILYILDSYKMDSFMKCKNVTEQQDSLCFNMFDMYLGSTQFKPWYGNQEPAILCEVFMAFLMPFR
jgi:hypothetical protein